MPNSRPFLVCTVYRPQSAHSQWIDLFEKEISIALTTGLETILKGDFNIDYNPCTNKKWLSLVQLFDLSQLVSESTRVTETTAKIIDHIYTSHPENFTECFISYYSISDRFPVCATRKINCKIIKNEHISSSYRTFKHFNEPLFLTDLESDLSLFSVNSSDIDEDFVKWHEVIMKHLDNHAPVKTKRIKSKKMPEWFTPEITVIQNLRDNCKRRKQWSDFKRYRNKVRQLIRAAKRKYFSDTIANTKDSKTIWQHLRSATNTKKVSSSSLSDELIINDKKKKKFRRRCS